MTADSGSGGIRGRVFGLGPSSANQNASPFAEAIEPADGERPVGGGVFQRRGERLDVRYRFALFVDPRRRDGAHLERDFEDVPREPHPAHARPEELGLLVRRALDQSAVGNAQQDGAYVSSKRAVDVMVLPVDVRRDHAADRHVLRARCYWSEPTSRKKQAVQLAKRKSCLGAEDARSLIEGEHAIGERRRRHFEVARRGERRVAVGAAESPRKHGVPAQRSQVLGEHFLAGFREAAPSGEHGRRLSGHFHQRA